MRVSVLVALSLSALPMPAASQATVSVATRLMASSHHLRSGGSFGTDLTTYEVAGEAITPIGVGATVGVDLNRLGIDCIDSCSKTSGTGWAGLIGQVPVGWLTLRVVGEAGVTVWRGDWSRALRGTAWIRVLNFRRWQVEFGTGRVDLPPLGYETIRAVGLVWRLDR